MPLRRVHCHHSAQIRVLRDISINLVVHAVVEAVVCIKQKQSSITISQISHFFTPVKIRGGVGEISIPIV